MKRLAILGSTGSIGVNTLDVISRSKDKFEVVALSADSNIELLSKQADKFNPKAVSVRDGILARKIRRLVPSKTKVLSGIDGLKEIVARPDVDLIVFAVSGSACVIPLIEAIEKKKEIALANKESLVAAGAIITKKAAENNVNIIPIDSEHSAIFQCLEGKRGSLSRIYLTGSGGPLLNVPKAKFDSMPRKFILNHPKWKMGRKISVDSATMMNKGLEIIEAKWLFGMDESAIDVLIHPEAIIHSMIELVDGTVFGQMGVPDMRIPIQYALTYPARSKNIAKRLDFRKIGRLTFQKPDIGKFPCLGLSRDAIKSGGTYPAVLNGSDEEAVKDYLEGSIKFSDIPRIIEKVLARHRGAGKRSPSLGEIFEAEEWAKEETRSLCYR